MADTASGFRIPGIQYIDIECTCCGEHIIELTGADAFVEVSEHECPEGALLRFTAHEANFAECCRLLQTQWRRLA